MPREYQKNVNVESIVNLPLEPIFIENFDNPTDWKLSGVGGGQTAERRTDHTLQGKFSYYLTTGGPPAMFGDEVIVEKKLILSHQRYFTFEMTFYRDVDTIHECDFNIINFLDDTFHAEQYRFAIQIRDWGDLIRMETSPGIWTVIGSVRPMDFESWGRLKIVIDRFTKKIVEVQFLAVKYKIDQIGIAIGPAGFLNHLLQIGMRNRMHGGLVATHIDNINIKSLGPS